MARHVQSSRSRDQETFWLSTLVDAMEEAGRPEVRAVPCDRLTLKKFRAKLARANFRPRHGVSISSLRKLSRVIRQQS
jgi:hypothetical protein